MYVVGEVGIRSSDGAFSFAPQRGCNRNYPHSPAGTSSFHIEPCTAITTTGRINGSCNSDHFISTNSSSHYMGCSYV
jgi:hypothetical protein